MEMFLCSQGCSYWVWRKGNKWLSKLKHNHPLFILSPFVSHTAYCKRTPNVQRSHDSEELDVSSDEEQRSNEMCNCWRSKKCQHTKVRRQTSSIVTCGTKAVGLCFYFCIISHQKWPPLLNCIYPWRPKVQQATWLTFIHFLYPMTAHLNTINRRSEQTREERNEVDHHYTAKRHF